MKRLIQYIKTQWQKLINKTYNSLVGEDPYEYGAYKKEMLMEEAKYYKESDRSYHMITSRHRIIVFLDQDRPFIERQLIHSLSPNEHPEITMREFEQAYRVAEYRLRQFAIQSKKIKKS